MNFRRVIDILLTLALMLQMSMQITEQVGHEYSGIFMFILFLIHQYLNRRWYGALLKGKYNAARAFSTVVNLSLLIAFVMTAFSGIIMSENFPELNIEALYSFARLAHLSCAYLSFVLMGIHLGLHWGMIAGKIKTQWPGFIAILISLYGGYKFFITEKLHEYIFLINEFAFIDYDKNLFLVLLDNISMFVFWTSAGYYVSKKLRKEKNL